MMHNASGIHKLIRKEVEVLLQSNIPSIASDHCISCKVVI